MSAVVGGFILVAIGVVLAVIGAEAGGDLARFGGPFVVGALCVVGGVAMIRQSLRHH
jgi:hypothetical protein